MEPCDYENFRFHVRAQKPYGATDAAHRELRFRHSGKCIDIDAFKTADGTRAQQWDCIYAQNQVFKAELVDPDWGHWRFRDTHSNKCLNVDSDKKVVIRSCSTSYRQRFWLWSEVDGGGKVTHRINEPFYSLGDDLGRADSVTVYAPFLTDQVEALVRLHLLEGDHPEQWAQVYDRNGQRRYLVHLMFAKSADTRLRDNDWKYAQDVQAVANEVERRTGVRVGFALDTEGDDAIGLSHLYNVDAVAGAPALWRQPAVVGIHPFDAGIWLPSDSVSDVIRADNKRLFYEKWIRTGLPVVFDATPYYHATVFRRDHDWPPFFGTSFWWRNEQSIMLGQFEVVGALFTAWNGYSEGYAGVHLKDFHPDPNQPDVSRYEGFFDWAEDIFDRATTK